MHRTQKYSAVVLLMLTTPPACRKSTPPTAPTTHAATGSAGAAQTWSDPNRVEGLRITIPSGWTLEPRPEFVLNLKPAVYDDGGRLSIDAPELPAHIPGMIPLGLVVDGYIDDLKKLHADLKTERPPAPALAGAKVQKTSSRWQQDGVSWHETAVLAVHGDAVYIFRATSPAAAPERILGAMDFMISTLQWTK